MVKSKKEGGFRFNAKKVGLTYSALKEGEPRQPILSVEELKDHLVTFGKCMWSVAKELHQDGEIHYHAYVKYDTALNTVDARFFDFKGIHPNVLVPGNGWKDYVEKAGEFITNFHVSVYSRALNAPSFDAAIEIITREAPQDMVLNGDRVKKNLSSHFTPRRVPTSPFCGPYPESYFPKNWNPKTHSLLLWGKPGIGKTQFAKYLLGDFNYIRARVEQLKTIKFDKPFIFDEVYMLDAKPQDSRELTDIMDGGTITARYGDVYIPPEIPRIFIANCEHPFCNPQESVYNRRVHSHEVR